MARVANVANHVIIAEVSVYAVFNVGVLPLASGMGIPNHDSPVLIKFEIDSHEYNGRWFNEIEAWDISITQW